MARSSIAAPSVPLVPWPDFLTRLAWRQGEHVSLIGPTGTGKTTLGLALIAHRANQSDRFHAAVLATKPKDGTLSQLLRRPEWSRMTTWNPAYGQRRVVLWPRWRNLHDNPAQAEAFRTAFASMFAAGSWALMADEVSYLCRELHLEPWLKSFWQQGRSLGLSLVAGTQRPAWVPLDLYTQATHLFIWRTNDERDLRTIAGVGGLSSATIRAAVATLPEHQALYLNARTGRMARTVVTKGPKP